MNALITLTLTKFSRKVEAALAWGEEKRSLTGMSVSKMEISANFVETHFPCVWRPYSVVSWRRSVQLELSCEISRIFHWRRETEGSGSSEPEWAQLF